MGANNSLHVGEQQGYKQSHTIPIAHISIKIAVVKAPCPPFWGNFVFNCSDNWGDRPDRQIYFLLPDRSFLILWVNFTD